MFRAPNLHFSRGSPDLCTGIRLLNSISSDHFSSKERAPVMGHRACDRSSRPSSAKCDLGAQLRFSAWSNPASKLRSMMMSKLGETGKVLNKRWPQITHTVAWRTREKAGDVAKPATMARILSSHTDIPHGILVRVFKIKSTWRHDGGCYAVCLAF